ncbi:MAG: flagellar protein FlaG [Spongiibacteraceae bacterium]
MINDRVNNGYPATPVRISAPTAAAAQVSEPAVVVSEAEAETKPAEAQPTAEKLQAAVTKLNEHVQNLSRTLSFSIEESTGRTVIKVYDAETDELIRQIPPEETLKLAEILGEQTNSLLIKEQA